jgi:hypothetical protein
MEEILERLFTGQEEMTARLEAKIEANYEDIADPKTPSIFTLIYVKM